MNNLKDAGHLLRVAAVLLAGIAVFAIVRFRLVPHSFGEYGHYRGNSIAEIAAHCFAGHGACESCHAEIVDKKRAGKHAGVSCEACHEPRAKHVDDPAGIAPAKLDSAVLCVKCHEANPDKPHWFPQVASEEHSTGLPCDTCHQPHSPAIDSGGKKCITRRQMLMLLPATAVAWEYVLAGTPEASPNYNLTEHWWGMLVEHLRSASDAEIACVRVLRKMGCRTVISGPGLSAITSPYYDLANPIVDSPDGGKNGFPQFPEPGGKDFFVPKMCNHCADSPCTQVCPVGATFITPDGVVLVDKKYCIGCRYCIQACPYGCRFLNPKTQTAEKCTLCYHRITKGLTTACCEACPTGARQLADLKNPSDPIHAFLRTHSVQVLKPYMATGAKLFYNDLDGSVR